MIQICSKCGNQVFCSRCCSVTSKETELFAQNIKLHQSINELKNQLDKQQEMIKNLSQSINKLIVESTK